MFFSLGVNRLDIVVPGPESLIVPFFQIGCIFPEFFRPLRLLHQLFNLRHAVQSHIAIQIIIGTHITIRSNVPVIASDTVTHSAGIRVAPRIIRQISHSVVIRMTNKKQIGFLIVHRQQIIHTQSHFINIIIEEVLISVVHIIIINRVNIVRCTHQIVI